MRWSGLLLLVLLAGCGTKDGGSSFETPDQDGAFYVIHLTSDRTFDPDRAAVPTGAFVSFRFGLPDCDVRSDDPAGPDSRVRSGYATGIHPVGASYNWQAPDEPARFEVYCNRHYDAGMVATLRIG